MLFRDIRRFLKINFQVNKFSRSSFARELCVSHRGYTNAPAANATSSLPNESPAIVGCLDNTVEKSWLQRRIEAVFFWGNTWREVWICT